MKPVERDLRTYYTRRTHINIFIVSARLVPYVMWITHEHLYTIYLKEKKNRYSRHFAIVRILFFSDVLCNTVDKLAVFSQQVSHDSDAPVCSDRESVFVSVDLFPFFFSSRFPPILFFLLFHRHRPHACIFFFHAVRRPSSSSSRFLTSNAHWRAEAMYMVAYIYGDTLLSRSISIFSYPSESIGWNKARLLL